MGYSAIIDSSKTAWGSLSTPFRLKRQFGSEFMLVHLVRDPTAVCWSVLKQKDRKANREGRRVPHYLLRCSWMVVGWCLANLSSDLFGHIYPRHYVCIRYEDLDLSFRFLVPCCAQTILRVTRDRETPYVGLSSRREELGCRSKTR